MNIVLKILISIVAGGILFGGVFWYRQTYKAQTLFESQKEIIEKQDVMPVGSALEPTRGSEEIKEDDLQKNIEESQEKEETSIIKQEDTTISRENDSDKEIEPKSFALKSALVSFGHESASNRKIDTVVLHSSYNPNGDPYSVSAVRGIWQSYGVAPHYMVARDGTVYQLVADKDIAYHAGESTMKDGRKNVNDFSIGVEILNTKDDEYTKAQYQAVKDLIAYLKGKHSIKYVVGHDDIAPGRKTDPWNFDWNKI